jgi:hypothetical protein
MAFRSASNSSARRDGTTSSWVSRLSSKQPPAGDASTAPTGARIPRPPRARTETVSSRITSASSRAWTPRAWPSRRGRLLHAACGDTGVPAGTSARQRLGGLDLALLERVVRGGPPERPGPEVRRRLSARDAGGPHGALRFVCQAARGRPALHPGAGRRGAGGRGPARRRRPRPAPPPRARRAGRPRGPRSPRRRRSRAARRAPGRERAGRPPARRGARPRPTAPAGRRAAPALGLPRRHGGGRAVACRA